MGFILNTLAAIGQPDHYWSIVLPGMLVGVIVGVIAQHRRFATGVIVLALVAVSSDLFAQTGAAQSLAVLDGLIGRWQGVSEGEPGRGNVEREYTREAHVTPSGATQRFVYCLFSFRGGADTL